MDATRLAKELSANLRGEVRFDDASRALYATDASNYRQTPIGVVLPRDAEDVEAGLAICRAHGAPVLARGGGTSLAGQCCNVAVVFDFSRHIGRVLEIDPARRTARVQPGVVLDRLRAEAAPFGLTFGPDPSTHGQCTMAGMIGNNSCGVHSLAAGRSSDNVHELEVLTYEGERFKVAATDAASYEKILAQGGHRSEIYRRLRRIAEVHGPLIRSRFPKIPRRVSGYNLDELLPENGFHVARSLSGSEGTCVIMLEALVRLIPDPPFKALLVLGYPDIFSAADHVPEILRHEAHGLEAIDEALIADLKRKRLAAAHAALFPPGRGWLLVEFGGWSRPEAEGRAQGLMRRLRESPEAPSMRLYDDPAQARQVWKVRESGLGATARVPGQKDAWEGWEDSAVPPDRLGRYLREFQALLKKHGYRSALYGHFGQGCVHCRIDFDLTTREGLRRYRAFAEAAADLVVRHGGSLSGEHGDGQARAELLPKMFGQELLSVFREFKAAWDPGNKMNPGKLVDAYRLDENLRLGADYAPLAPATILRFPEDDGSFARAALRCVGVGDCRKEKGGVMCPSYRATLEERHSTRGRAHLLFEMLRGSLPLWGEPVHEALDLCLSCKGCKSDCPMSVDMAAYKAEFLSHYYRGRLRPRSAYSMGWVHRWAALAAKAPRAANALASMPLLSSAIKWAAGIAPQRRLPRFSERSFRAWMAERRPHAAAGAEPVILWPDTFTNYFHPEVGRAAAELLEAAGCLLEIPPAGLCCGRPLYDYGMLGEARRLLQRVLESLRPRIRAGAPLIALEPGCLSVFRDELAQLFPQDQDARRLSEQSFSLDEFLCKRRPGFNPGELQKRALVHGHCHQKALVGMSFEESLLRKAGLQIETLDAGCCGMAGAFGFEKAHYEVSQRCGELGLFPAVRAAAPDTLLVADGFSCREQILQATGRRALHLAQVLRLALDHGGADYIY